MITKEDFLTDFNGHGNAYSSYMVIDTNVDVLVKVLNDIDPDMCVGSGQISETGRSIYFEICKRLPDLIHVITSKLNCKGFADICGWYGDGYMEASDCGLSYDDYTAEWANEDQPERRDYDHEDPGSISDSEIEWDAFVDITDNGSGEIFHTGEGCISYDTMQMWKDIVEKHQK